MEVSSLPSRPLTKSEVISMDDKAREYCIRPESDEAYIICFIGESEIHALGFDSESEQWVQFFSTGTDYSDEAFEEYEEQIYSWARQQYEARLDSGELQMSGPSDPPTDEKNERPSEVENGLEPEYDCPDCGYYETGLTISPQTFLDHLEMEHDYTRSEAHEILNS
mgnify:CR=1 FL=1